MADFFPIKPKESNICIDYITFAYGLCSTQINNFGTARKTFKFLKDEDENKNFWFTYVFNRSLGETVLYTAALSLFENTHDVLSFDKLDSRVFTFVQEKLAFEHYKNMKDLFMPVRQAQFLYKGAALPQLEVDKLLIDWSRSLRTLIKE